MHPAEQIQVVLILILLIEPSLAVVESCKTLMLGGLWLKMELKTMLEPC